MNTNGPTDVTACLQRRVTSSPDRVPGAGVIHAPPDVSNITVLVLSSTCGTGGQHESYCLKGPGRSNCKKHSRCMQSHRHGMRNLLTHLLLALANALMQLNTL